MKAKIDWVIQEPPRKHASENKSLDLDFDTISSVFDNAIIDKDYYNFIRNKRVIIVGPAGYLRGQKKGDFIDEFDIVVRINRSFPLDMSDYEDLGKRTDIRYHNGSQNLVEGGPLHLDHPDISNLKYISCIFPRHLDYFDHHINEMEKEINKSNSNVKFHSYTDIEQFVTFHHMMQVRPNAGVALVLDLLNYDPAQIHLSGMTFFKGKSLYIDSYSDNHLKDDSYHVDRMQMNHAQGPQRDMIKLLADNLDIITMDQEVKTCLEN